MKKHGFKCFNSGKENKTHIVLYFFCIIIFIKCCNNINVFSLYFNKFIITSWST